MMQTDYRDFNNFDFHDAYFKRIEMDGKRLIWYLEAVHVLPGCRLNPQICSMRASELRVEFVDYKVENQEVDVKRLAEEIFEIIEVKKISEENQKYTYLFCMVSHSDYQELKLTFKNVLFDWETYESKAWYVYVKEKDTVNTFLDKNPHVKWLKVENIHEDMLATEFYRELHPRHALYGVEAMALAKSEGTDEVLFSLGNGKCAIVHLTYAKEKTEKFPLFLLFDTVEQSLKHITADVIM